MSLFSTPQILFAADDGGAGGGAPKGVSPAAKNLENVLSSLDESNKRLYKMLNKTLGVGADEKDDDKGESLKDTLMGPFKELREAFDPKQMFKGILGGDEAGLLGGILGGEESDSDKMQPKEKPKMGDMMKMSAGDSMGFTFLYWKLDEIAGLLQAGGSNKKEEQGKGIGGFFSGLLKGAAGLALLAGAMMIFAGALLLFTQLEGADWAKALAGIGMFALFVAGAVVVAKAVNKNMDDFAKFAQGVILLTAGMILFGAAVFVMAWILPYVIPAIPGIALFSAFVLGMAGVSKIVGKEMANFTKFALGMVILTGAIILFAAAIFVMNWVLPYIPDALIGLGLFMGFTIGMVVLAKILGSQIGSFAQFIAGTVLMSVGLVLFAGALWLVNNMLTFEEIGLAAAKVGLMMVLAAAVGGLGYLIGFLLPGLAMMAAGSVLMAVSMGAMALAVLAVRNISTEDVINATDTAKELAKMARGVGFLGYTLGFALPGLALLAIGATALAVGMLAFSVAIKAVASVADDVPIAIPALRDMMRFLTNPRALKGGPDGPELVEGEEPGVLELLSFVGVSVLAKLALFGMALTPFANGMRRFAETIRAVAEVGDYVAPGIVGVEKMMKFLTNPAGKLSDSGERLNPEEAPGVLELLDAVSGVTLIKLGLFGLALQPFSEAMLNFAQVIKLLAEIGSPDLMDRSIIGVGNMMGLLVGGGPSAVPQESSVVGMMDGMRLRVAVKIAAFGAAFGPLSEALLNFANVIEKVAELGDKVDAAKPGLQQMFLFLADQSEGAISVATLVGAIDRDVSRNLERFGEGLQPFATGMLTFTDVVTRVMNIEGSMQPALDTLTKMMTFLGSASDIAAQVGGGGGFLGLGASNMEKFEEAIEPFGNGIGAFIDVARGISRATDDIDQADSALATMTDMLVAAGAVVDRGGSRDRVREFSDSLSMLGEGINEFNGEIEGTSPFVLDRIADALERIAEIQFGQMFTPFISFMSHNEELRETATQLERISEAIEPKEPNTLDRIGGAIGSIFNRQGGSRTAMDESAMGTPDFSENGVEANVATLTGIISKWDTERQPIVLTGDADTNIVVMPGGGGGSGNNFGGNY